MKEFIVIVALGILGIMTVNILMEQVDVAQERKHNGSVTTPKAPMTDEQRLAEIVSDALDEVESENIGKFAIKKMPMENAPDAYRVSVSYDALPYYGGKLIKYDGKTLYKAIFTAGIPIAMATITVKKPLTDVYGYVAPGMVYSTVLVGDVGHRINWANRGSIDMDKLAITTFVHPDL